MRLANANFNKPARAVYSIPNKVAEVPTESAGVTPDGPVNPSVPPGHASQRGPSARAREQQILDCGLAPHLKNLLLRMYRHGDWETGDRIYVSNATLARELSTKVTNGVHVTRGIQKNIGTLLRMKILEAVGPRLPTRQRNGRIDCTVLTARRGGREANTYGIRFDALPPPIPTEGRTPDHPSLFEEAAGEGRTPVHPWGEPQFAQGRIPVHPWGDPQFTRSSPGSRPNVGTATADAAAFPEIGPLKTVPKIDCGHMPPAPFPATAVIRLDDKDSQVTDDDSQVKESARLDDPEAERDCLEQLRRRVAGLAIGLLVNPGRGVELIQEPITSESTLIAATKALCGREGVRGYHEVVVPMCASVWWKRSDYGEAVIDGRARRPRDLQRERRRRQGSR